MARIDDIELVRRDYSDPSRLEERFRAWREYHDPDMLALIRDAIAEEPVAQVLEVGCGDGRFSDQLRSELPGEVRVVALDFSPGMAAEAALRGLDVQIGDIQLMPWPEAQFDVVVANWMLYHVPDLDAGLQEIRRVLRPGGRLVASTMGLRHMRELWDRVGDEGTAPALRFSNENGAEVLGRHFTDVEQRSMAGTATFPDHAAAVRHVRTSLTRAHLADQLEPFDGPLRVTTTNTMFVARRD
ncbi:MAG: class SAM-dependent methyltransferase [Thermoleophilia bacterium]|nr:class SAM-dependent methyltransferase [Thermoleophilia bacterium]